MVIAKVWMSKVSIWLIGMCLLVCTAGIVLGTRARTSWEPRGRITYVKNVWTGNEGVYVTDPDGNNVKRLTSLSCTDVAISPVWSPDGNYIAFGCRGAEGNNLCLMDTAGLWPPAPTCFDSASLIDPEKVPSKFCDEYHVHSISWAPDGQRLAFTCPYQQGIASSELVCIIDLTGDVDCWPLSVIDRGGAEIHGMAKVAWSPTDERLAI
jgi:WD40 repeat protein